MKIPHNILKDEKVKRLGGQFTYVIPVRTNRPEKIWVTVFNALQPHTFYINRYKTIDGNGVFYVRMPQPPKQTIIQLYNEKNGDIGADYSFVVGKIKVEKLNKKLTSFDFTNPLIRDAVQFFQWFTENAGILSANGSVYMSNKRKITIKYVNVIKDKNGRTLNTPAMIGKKTGIITVARNKFLKFSVSGRMAILLHEFSHFYLNKIHKSEKEADLNALMIYLGLGYPRIEAEEVFLKVFKGADNQENRDRALIIDRIVRNFDNYEFRMLG